MLDLLPIVIWSIFTCWTYPLRLFQLNHIDKHAGLQPPVIFQYLDQFDKNAGLSLVMFVFLEKFDNVWLKFDKNVLFFLQFWTNLIKTLN